MLNVDLVGAAKFNIQHSTFNIPHSRDFVGAVKFNIQHSTFNTPETLWVQLNSTFNIPHSTLPILTLQLDFSFE